MKRTWILLGALVVVVLISFGSIKGNYNQIVTLHENVETSWAQVENVLQRRNDLIPNLVNTVKGYAAQEERVLTEVTEARAKASGAQTIPEKVDANNQLSSALSRLLVVVEKYPDLKSNQNFLALQDELAGTENRIAVERKRYNEAVQGYNTTVRRFPTNIIAGAFGYERQNRYFEATEGATEVPQVNFDTRGGGQ
ncbi:MAG: LemA family protein [Deltaproteobacteria bacterium RIFCSPLOWO2_02_FULL_44_10]|nr:MAG: LemA family protein [Deltaproteobacteria bacterium RIFCSPHIGHO2_02_FULL_44_16]OGQ46961.1 MAG: LemA family protein [Deltaproteobacteria bacterium RIFCSPLOWO2_02_FULL_44_10]